MAHAERVDEPFERDVAPRLDRREQVAYRQFAKTFRPFELDRRVARFEREDVGRLLDPALLEEQFDLLLAEPFYIEGTARDEVLEVLDLLVWAGEFAGAARDRALLPGGS